MKLDKKVNLSFVLILFVLLLMSIFYNIKLKNQLDKFLIKQDIKGTYFMKNQNIDDSEYFVFVDGSFYRYKQFEVLDEGNYENIHDNIYFLKSNNIDTYIVYSNEKLYFYNKKQNNILVYSRMSNEPVFINVKIKR